MTPPRGQRGRRARHRATPRDDQSLADLLGIAAPPAWTADAACAQGHPDAWFPEHGEPNTLLHATYARRICAACPVRAQCLRMALDNPELEGIWAGTSHNDRKLLRRPLLERPAA